MDGEGEIHVKGYRKEDDIYIEVSDNGLGMPQDMVEQLLTDNNRVRKHGSGVGVINVHNRIRLRFASHMALKSRVCRMREPPFVSICRIFHMNRKNWNCWKTERCRN